MPSNIKNRLEAAIREADERSRNRFREAHAVDPHVAKAFAPVAEAAQDLNDYLRSIP